jgi:hypothetical protein
MNNRPVGGSSSEMQSLPMDLIMMMMMMMIIIMLKVKMCDHGKVA